jgi:hypothetical protein
VITQAVQHGGLQYVSVGDLPLVARHLRESEMRKFGVAFTGHTLLAFNPDF